MNKIFFLAVGLLFSISQFAQKADTATNIKNLKLDEVVISATKTENRILDVPSRISIVTPMQLRSIPVHTVDDYLAYLPGVNINRPFGIFSGKATVSMRGLSGLEQARTLVLIDGIPVNKTDGGSVNWNLINTDNVERIEVTKGPGSSLYGGNAMGGIINVITKKPVEKLSGKLTFEGGTYNTYGSRLSLSGRMKAYTEQKGFYWNLNGFARQSDGYISQSKPDITQYTVKSGMKEGSGGVKLGYDFNANQNVEFDLRYYDDMRETGEKVYQTDGNYTQYETYQTRATYKANVNGTRINASIFYIQENYKKQNEYMKDASYTLYDVDSKRKDMGLLFTASHDLGKYNNVTAGFDLKQGSVDASDVYYTSTDKVNNAGKMNFYAAFAQDEIKLWKEKVKIIAGLRYDYASFFDGKFDIENPSVAMSYMTIYQIPSIETADWSALSPKLSLQYEFNKQTRTYLSFSQGFRPSVLDDMCRSGKIKGGFKVANPKLKPEFITNYEWGMDASPWEKLHVAASVYYSTGKDFMYYVSTGKSIDLGYSVSPVYECKNISKVEIYGAEAEVNYDLTQGLSIFANYTYTHSKIKKFTVTDPEVDADLTGKYLTNVAPNLFTAGFNWNNRMVNVSAFYRFTDQMWINDSNGYDDKYLLSYKYPSYSTIDVKVSKILFKHYSIGVNIQNLTDQKYYDSKAYVCPGRFITGELAIHF